MKESLYNFVFEHNSAQLGFNAMTCAFAEVDNEFFDALSQVRQGKKIENDEIKESMYYGGFITNDGFDERQYLRIRSWQNKFSSKDFGITIAPTLACNFACPYCYENSKQGMIEEDVQEQIINMIKEAAEEKKNIQVTWYGGEPLLALDIIESMSGKILKLCEENKVEYFAYMVTNGYLLSESTIKKLKKCAIENMQITIDGPSDIHDSRRKLKGSGKGSFNVIINNVMTLVENGVYPEIRINVDKTNKDRLSELINFLKERGLEKCQISFGHVNAYTEACANIEGTCLNVKEYALETIEYQRLLFDNGFPSNEYPLYPGIKGNYCCADNINSFVIDPDGLWY